MNTNSKITASVLLSIYCWAVLLLGVKTLDGSIQYATLGGVDTVEQLMSTDLGISLPAFNQTYKSPTTSNPISLYKVLIGDIPNDLWSGCFSRIRQFVLTSAQIASQSNWLRSILFPNHYFW